MSLHLQAVRSLEQQGPLMFRCRLFTCSYSLANDDHYFVQIRPIGR